MGDSCAITVHWRYAFKRDGRVAWHYCGTWPMTSLEAVRAARDEARGALKRRVDPNIKREADRIAERERLEAAIAADAQRRAEDAAKWEHVDLDAGTWLIPKANTKGSRGKTRDQLVFLSDFARSRFNALRSLTGHTPWCFPSRNGQTHVDVKTVTKQVGDRQHRFKDRKTLKGRRNDNTLVLAGGGNGEWTPHDLRRTAATMMQALGVSPDVIDRCQNHVLAGSRVRRHYLTHEYNEEKREAWRGLGAEIERILAAPAAPSRGRPPHRDSFQQKVIASHSTLPA